MKESSNKETHKGYSLNFYPKCDMYPKHDNKYQLFKPRPYDDADYYNAYSYDKMNWTIIYKGKKVQQFAGTFEEVVDLVEERNKNIRARIIHG